MAMNLSRRDALRAAGVLGGGAALAALAGCAPTNMAGSAGDGKAGSATQGGDWLGEAPAVSKKDCTATFESDVVVLGSAVAGSWRPLPPKTRGRR